MRILLLLLPLLFVVVAMCVVVFVVLVPSADSTTTTVAAVSGPSQTNVRSASSTTSTPVVPGPVPVPGKVDLGPDAVTFGIMPNWWGSENDPKLDPIDVVDKLGVVPYLFGTFVDVRGPMTVNPDDYISFADKILAVKNKHTKNHWNAPFTFDVAVLPHGGLQHITDQLITQFAHAFKRVQEKGVVVRTRFLHELNGDWYTGFSQKPEESKALFIKWHTIIKGIAPEVHIQFNPNFNFRECGGLFDPETYWPGPQYFDSIGIDIYFQSEGECNKMSTGSEILASIDKCGLYEKMCRGPNLPLYIAETGRAHKKDARCNDANSADFEMRNKQTWWKQLMDPELKKRYPLYRGFNWFNYRKTESGEDRDFRITHDPAIAAAFRQDLLQIN